MSGHGVGCDIHMFVFFKRPEAQNVKKKLYKILKENEEKRKCFRTNTYFYVLIVLMLRNNQVKKNRKKNLKFNYKLIKY